RNCGEHPSLGKPVQHLALRFRDATSGSFQFERKAPTVMPEEKVRCARDHTKALEDCALNGRPRSTIGGMQEHQAPHAAHLEMVDDGLVDNLFRPAAAHNVRHRFPLKMESSHPFRDVHLPSLACVPAPPPAWASRSG